MDVEDRRQADGFRMVRVGEGMVYYRLGQPRMLIRESVGGVPVMLEVALDTGYATNIVQQDLDIIVQPVKAKLVVEENL